MQGIILIHVEMMKNIMIFLQAANQIKKLYELFCKVDATQVEINPLGETPDGRGECTLICPCNALDYETCIVSFSRFDVHIMLINQLLLIFILMLL